MVATLRIRYLAVPGDNNRVEGVRMSLETDIAKLMQQEEILRFDRFDEAEAWTLGTRMRAAANDRNLPLVIDVRIGNRPLFYTALPGSTPENPDWVRRKVNTVLRFHKSSYRIGREYLLRGMQLDSSRGVDAMDYVAAGGGFPIHIRGVGVIGAVTVSGVPQREDHGFVAEMLALHLGADHGALALGPE